MSINAVVHCAKADVQGMKEAFASSKLEPLLTRLTLHSKSKINKTWSSKNNKHKISQQLFEWLGKDCTKKIIRFYEDGITYDSFHHGFQHCSLEQEFKKWLQNTGVLLLKLTEKDLSSFLLYPSF